MGAGIAQLCAVNSFPVRVLEVDRKQLDRGLAAIKTRLARDAKRGRISQEIHDTAMRGLTGTTDFQDLAGCDLIIEAAFEDAAIKGELFAQLGAVCKPEAILATNTSALSVSALAAASDRPESVIGLHFFNPPAVLRLVEMIITDATSPATIDMATAFCEDLDRTVVRVKDTPGFIVNRLLIPFIFEAIRLVESGTATAEHIDEACRAGLSHTMGPLATADLVGLDTVARIGDSMYEESGDLRHKAPTLLRRMVSLGNLGRKSGNGFFEYSG